MHSNLAKRKMFLPVLAGLAVVAALALAAVASPVFAAQAAEDRGGSAQATQRPPGSGEIELTGAIEALDSDTVTVNGKSIAITALTEIKGTLAVGALVKIHASAGADGSLTAREIEPARADQAGDDNSMDDAYPGDDSAGQHEDSDSSNDSIDDDSSSSNEDCDDPQDARGPDDQGVSDDHQDRENQDDRIVFDVQGDLSDDGRVGDLQPDDNGGQGRDDSSGREDRGSREDRGGRH